MRPDRGSQGSRACPAVLAVSSLCALLAGETAASSPGAVPYRLSLRHDEHRLIRLAVTWPDVPAGPLQLRMSRSSPGRYAMHEFAKNVFDVRVSDEQGKALAFTRPNPHQWDVVQ